MDNVRVAITGLGLVTPLGIGVKASWSGLVAGESGVGYISRFDPTRLGISLAAEVRGFRPEAFLSPGEIRSMSLATQFAIAASEEATRDANLGNVPYRKERVGVTFGVGLGLIPDYEYIANPRALPEAGGHNEKFIPKTLGNMAAAHISVRAGAKGPVKALSSSCCSGTTSIGEGMRLIREGYADAVICGGAESCIFELAMSGFQSMGCLTRKNESRPAKAVCPFDARRDGFVMGEGAGIMVLERLDGALSRGAAVHAELRGYGTNASAYHITLLDPSGESQAGCMEGTLRDADVRPGEIDYINAHGSSTVSNDKTETNAIKRLFGKRAYALAVSSTKSMTGHLLGASGAIEAVFSALTLREQVLPPTINYEEFDPDCDLDYVPNASRKARVRHMLTNSFAFGGTNASLLLSAFDGN